MNLLQKVEGIVIKTIPYGESNSIVTLYTKEAGKIGVMARGAKKPKSRLSSVTQLFTYGIYVVQKGNGLGTLNQGEALDSFRSIREDLFKTAYAAYLAEFLDKISDEKRVNPYLFTFLHQAFHYINEGTDPEVITFLFEMKMLMEAGIAPRVNGCARCGTTEGTFFFSVAEGGFLCQTCAGADPYKMAISSVTARLLRLFYHFDLNRLGNVSLKEETKQEIRTILDLYEDAYLGIFLKSKKFLNSLRKMGFDS